MLKHNLSLAEVQAYVITTEKVQIGNYSINMKLEEESEFSFTVQLKLKEKDSGQEKLLKFRIGIEQHESNENIIHNPEEPHFEIDYYKREDSKGIRAYFTLKINDKQHLMDCIKGTLVVLKEFLEQFGQRIGHSNLVKRIVYKEAIESELNSFKPVLINVLYESYKDGQLTIKIDGEKHVVTTKRNLQKYLDIEEIQPIYIPLLEKIDNE